MSGFGGTGAGAGAVGMATTNSASSNAKMILKNHLIGTTGYYLINDVDYLKYNQLLALIDSIHDEWNDTRGDLTDSERSIIRQQLILASCKILGISPSEIPAGLAYNDIMNRLLAQMSGTLEAPILNVSNIEKTNVAFLEQSDPDRIYPFDPASSFSFDDIVSLPDYSAMYELAKHHRTCRLSSKGGRTILQLSIDEKKKISDFIKIFMFGTDIFKTTTDSTGAVLFDGMDRSKMTYVTADAGIGQISDIMEMDEDSRGLVTQATIVDSAISSSPKIGTNGDLYMFVPLPSTVYPAGDGLAEVFVTRNNTFTAQSGYQIGMINQNLTSQKNDFDFVIQKFTDTKTPVFTKAFNLAELGAKQGASLPYILDLSIAAQNGEELAAVPHSRQMIPIGNLDTEFAAAITKDIQEGNGNLFFDVKRGGDLDQIVAAAIAARILSPYILFVTIDVSAFYAAIKESIPAIRRYSARKGDDEFYLARPYQKSDDTYNATTTIDPVRVEKAYILRYINMYYQLMTDFPEANVRAFLEIDPSTIPFTHTSTKLLFVSKIRDISTLLINFLFKRNERRTKATIVPKLDGLDDDQIKVLKSEIEDTIAEFRSIQITPDMLVGICETFYGKSPVPMDMAKSYAFCNYSLDMFTDIDKSFTEMEHIDELVGIYTSPLDPFEVTDSVFRTRLTRLLNSFYDKESAESIRTSLVFENVISFVTEGTTVGKITPAVIRKGVSKLRGYIQEYRDNEKAMGLGKRARKPTSKINVKELVTKEQAMSATNRLMNGIKAYYSGLNDTINVPSLRILLDNPAIEIVVTKGGGKKSDRQKGKDKHTYTQRGGSVVLRTEDAVVVADIFETLCAKASEFINNYIAKVEPSVSLVYAVANIQHEYDVLVSLGKTPSLDDPASKPLLNAIRGFAKESALFTGNSARESEIVSDIVGTRLSDIVANRTVEHIKKVIDVYCGAGASEPKYSLAQLQALIPSTDVIELVKELKNEWILSTQPYADDPVVEYINLLLEPYTTVYYDTKTKKSFRSEFITIKPTHPLTYLFRDVTGGGKLLVQNGYPIDDLISHYENDAVAELQALMTLALANDFMNPVYARNQSVFLPYLYKSNPARLQIGVHSPDEWKKLKNRLYVYYTAIVLGKFPDELKRLLGGRRRKTIRRHNKAPNPYMSYTAIAKSLKTRQKRRKTRRSG